MLHRGVRHMKLLRVNEVARELGVSEAWLRRADGRGYTEADIAVLRAVLLPTLRGNLERVHTAAAGEAR